MTDVSRDRLIKLIRIFTRKQASLSLIGEYQSAFKGSGLEFQEVRPYQPGDDIRFIDWNVTARTGQPHIKRFHEERQMTVYFLLDVSSSMTRVNHPVSKVRTAAEITALLSTCALANKDRTGLILYSDRIHGHIPPSSSGKQISIMLESILSDHEETRETDLNGALEYLIKVQKRRTVIILISDGYHGGGDELLRYASHRHDVIYIHMLSSLDRAIPEGGLYSLEDPETGEQFYFRPGRSGRRWAHYYEGYLKEVRDKLRAFGCDYLSLTAGEDYAAPLSRFFLARENRGDYRRG